MAERLWRGWVALWIPPSLSREPLASQRSSVLLGTMTVVAVRAAQFLMAGVGRRALQPLGALALTAIAFGLLRRG
jgi:hypothetical protein